MHVVANDLVILSSAVIVLGGLAALVRALLKFRDDVRDNTRATAGLTRRIDNLEPLANGVGHRLERVERMLVSLWTRVFPGDPPPD